MKINRNLFLLIFLLLFIQIYGQGSTIVRIMSYNTLNTNCDNSWSSRVQNFTPIVQEINPDIIVQIELTHHQDTLAFIQAINNADIGTFVPGDYVTCSCSDRNLVYYKQNEFTFLINESIPSGGNNNFNLFKLIHNATQDTIFIFAVHLAPSSSGASTRTIQINNLRNYIQSNLENKTNFLILGDFNIEGPSEQAYQNLLDINSFGYVFDPVNSSDDFITTNWDDSTKYWKYLSASTRYLSISSCSNDITGGSRKRFDMILFSNSINTNSNFISYVDSSFNVFGQDGLHHDAKIIDYPIIPEGVAIADDLYYGSDHFPVYADFRFDNYEPVQLTVFTALFDGNNVILNWNTATELKNYGFDIERSSDSLNWNKIGFVPGHGNSNIPHDYSFTDNSLTISGKYYYRLKQIDNDGTFVYSKLVKVEVTSPGKFSLEQNYPNPFNPTTIINFTLPIDGFVSIKIFDVVGREVSTIINQVLKSGSYRTVFNAVGLSSGVYFYRMIAEPVDTSIPLFIQTKSLIILK